MMSIRYRKEHPICEVCESMNVLTPSEEVDHILPVVRGGAKFDKANLQALCKSCHSTKTKRENS